MNPIPDEFICPITLDIMKDPVLCEDGYTYERTAIMSIQPSKSPMTRQPFDKSKLIPNRALKNAIDRFLSSNIQYQSILLEKQKKEKEECDKEMKAKLELEHKLEKEENYKKRYNEIKEKHAIERKLEKERSYKYKKNERNFRFEKK